MTTPNHEAPAIEQALLPCPVPWCGSNVLETVRMGLSWQIAVVCQDCRCQGPWSSTEAEAIAAWNRRPTPTAGGGDSRLPLDRAREMIELADDALFEAGRARFGGGSIEPVQDALIELGTWCREVLAATEKQS